MPFMSLKKLSRSRSASESYADDSDAYTPNDRNVPLYDDGYGTSANYAHQSDQHPNGNGNTMALHDLTATQNDHAHASHQSLPTHSNRNNLHNGYPTANSAPNSGRPSITVDTPTSATFNKTPGPVDVLTQAFHTAMSPYTHRIDELEAQVEDLRHALAQADAHHDMIHRWIDNRGLRPDVPESVAKHMDARDSEKGSTAAAVALNLQLDRKITVVNFDLHRLQDDLNNALPLPSFSQCMLKFLPDVARLADLPGGPEPASVLIKKLGGNVLLHSGTDAGDNQERISFFDKLDHALYPVMDARIKTEGYGWIQRENRELKRFVAKAEKLKMEGASDFYQRTIDLLDDAERHAVGKGDIAGQPAHMDGSRDGAY